MKEAYCSYEVSKLLKEKGFDEECTHYYSYEDDELIEYTNGVYSRNSKDCHRCTSPTHQMACAWLREEKNIHIDFYYLPIHKKYMWSVVETKDPKGTGSKELYEDAVEAALKYILENLI
jgi:hypothetical protein